MRKEKTNRIKYVMELFDPIIVFETMVERKNLIRVKILAFLIGICSFCAGILLNSISGITIIDFTRDMIGDFITVTALFVSFTMGYLSIMITSSSENIIDLKNEYSKKFFGKDKEPYSLYQILTTQITYSVICEIAFLILCIFEKCIINYLPGLILKAICSANIALFMYILFVLLIIIKNIYFSFWRSK